MTAYFADDPECRVVGLFLETRAPAGGVRGGAAADRRGRQGGRRAQGRHVGDGRAGGARAHRRAGRLRPAASPAMLRYYNAIRCDDFGTWLEHLEVFSRASAAARPADRRRHQLGRRGRVLRRQGRAGGDPAAALSERAAPPGSQRSSRTSPHVGNPADCWAIDDDRVVFPRVFEMMAESGEFDVLVSDIDHSNWLVGGERRAGAEHRRRPAAPPARAPTSSRA